jgi:hypothetical protein
MAGSMWHRPQLSKLGFRQANLDSISMALAPPSSPRYRERRLPSLISGTFGLTTVEHWLRSNLDSIRLRLKGVDSQFSGASNVFNDLQRELDRMPANLDNCGLCHATLILPSCTDVVTGRAGVAQTLLSVLWQDAAPDVYNVNCPASMNAFTFAMNWSATAPSMRR